MSAPTLVWFRQDLRLDDNPALAAAAARGGPIVPVYVWAPDEEGDWPPGGAARWWLHRSLAALDASLRAKGSRLILRRGPSFEALAALADERGAEAVYWNRRYEPAAIARDAEIKRRLAAERGLTVASFNGALLWEPWTAVKSDGTPYRVFTPFWKACLERGAAPPAAAPAAIPAPAEWPASEPLEAFELEPKIDWAAGLRAAWTPGEAGARAALARFLDAAVASYSDERDRPDREGVSRLSPYLHWGEISPRRVWRETEGRKGAGPYLRQLVWREFGHHLLYHFPETPLAPLRPEFELFPWRPDEAALRAWRRGRTGYPIVDAGMRELWTTGYMHNRVRMIVASFLVKNLLVPWQEGAKWFWDTLVDADLANNTLGWQWTAGCGADAAPYFRIFNPTSQAERFDPEGAYVRRWVPELAALPDRWLHRPWEAPAGELRQAGVAVGETYPRPIVDHAEARERALAAFAKIKRPG